MQPPDLRGRDVVHQFVAGTCTASDALRDLFGSALEPMGAAMAGFTVGTPPSRPHSAVCTHDEAAALEAAQYSAGRGPCLHALRSGARVMVTNVVTESRWPEFAKAAADRGVAASLSLPVTLGVRTVGALNFYARELGAFSGGITGGAEGLVRDTAIITAHQRRGHT